VTRTARQPAHARGVLAQYNMTSFRVLAFVQHILSLSFLNITDYKYMQQKRLNWRSMHAHSALSCRRRRYANRYMLDAHWYLPQLLSPFFLHHVTGEGHIKPFRNPRLPPIMLWHASAERTTRLKKRRS
jgi:hypothetical protein